ncbi:MAG: WYL domain-containing protein [Muribaculaceae bacterium]|nr:WYL domain-containing protein [Muribaculaceae bacterium]
MKRDLFRRYVWLIDTVRHAKKLPFEDIAERWLKSPLNADHSQLALRTFHNHRHAIESLFGIRITCDRSDHNRYFIADWPEGNATKLKVWMLQKLSFSDLDEDSDPVRHRIILDLPPEERYGLSSIIEAIQKNTLIRLICAIPTSDGKTNLMIAPYCLRYWRGQWFILGKDTETDMLHAFNFDRVLDIQLTETHFDFPKDFSPEVFFRDFYGMDVNAMQIPEVVRLKISGRTRDEVRTLPLHNSQKEVMTNGEYSLFEFYLVPSETFQTTILSHGTDTEVVYPESLRESIGEKVRAMAERYTRHLESSVSTAHE